jgi:sulfite dehydrogenase (cytochrome) subunit B
MKILVLLAASAIVTVVLPRSNIAFKPGPNVDLATANCRTCHSAAYVYTQPPLNRAQWTAEVLKMKNLYGAPIEQDNVDKIVDYLMSQDGKP